MQDTPPNPFQIERGYIVSEEGKRGGLQYRALGDPLEVYLRDEKLTKVQFLAGRKLYRLWYGSARKHRTMRFSDERSSGLGGSAFFLGAEYREAIEAIRGHNERTAAYAVCVEGMPVSDIPCFSSRRSARRHGFLLLRSALDDLAAHFKIKNGH